MDELCLNCLYSIFYYIETSKTIKKLKIDNLCFNNTEINHILNNTMVGNTSIISLELSNCINVGSSFSDFFKDRKVKLKELILKSSPISQAAWINIMKEF